MHYILRQYWTLELELEFNVPCLGSRTSNIASDIFSSVFIQNASMSTCCLHNRIAKVFLKSNDVFLFFMQPSKRTKLSNDEHNLGFEYLNYAALFTPTRENENLLVMSTDRQVNNTSPSISLHEQSFYQFHKSPGTKAFTTAIQISQPIMVEGCFSLVVSH